MIMTHSLPTWLRAFRVAAFASAIFQIIYTCLIYPTAYAIPWGYALGYQFIFCFFLFVAPWLYTPRAWVWWLSYALMVYGTYNICTNVIRCWADCMAYDRTPFFACSINFKFMMLYAAETALFLAAQIIVLPFYRKLSVQLTHANDLVPA
jgi:hypothetical protein